MSDGNRKENQFTEMFYSHVKIETSPRSISNLFLSERKSKKIDYKPYYQRNYVWDDVKATYFIESILLGTEIPPLIFFNEGNKIEVIDGRQRFETIKRFLNNEFNLASSGLTALVDMSGKYIDNFRSTIPHIYELFIDAKIRIIEFKLVNNPPNDPLLIDRIKKEIFSRYNSGITPLKKSEIDNAVYDSDALSQHFKSMLKNNEKELLMISNLFLRQFKNKNNISIESILSFVRKSLVLHKFPIKNYATGKLRIELIKKFYEYSYSNLSQDEIKQAYNSFMEKINLIEAIKLDLSSDKEQYKESRLFYECLLWGMNILEQEEENYKDVFEKIPKGELLNLLIKNEELFDITNSHHYKKVVNRHKETARFLGQYCAGSSFHLYTSGDPTSSENIKKILSYDNDSKTELEKLSTLRITKPDPARSCIEDILSDMQRNRFLVRPSYQRSEVINLGKSSSIIESILLGIMLPAIFVYKHKNGVIEVIDGQQRLLTILSFMGKKYLDENDNYQFSKNNSFSLKGLRVLTHLNGSKFDSLPEDLQDKIWDFELFIVEIGEQLNPDFNPVDLFIRLNDKPYPIKENSFEMWNSWVDKKIVDSIKLSLSRNNTWFYIKNPSKVKFKDRMENEELITILSYYNYKSGLNKDIGSFLAIYQVDQRINARVKDKKNVTSILFEVTEDDDKKNRFLKSIDNVSKFIDKLRIVLDQSNNGKDLEEKFNLLTSSGSQRRHTTRTLQEIYILWYLLESSNDNHLKKDDLYKNLEKIFFLMKNLPLDPEENTKGNDLFMSELNNFKALYSHP